MNIRNLALAVVLLVLPMEALAQGDYQGAYQEEYHKNIKVFQQKPILEKNRLELFPFASLTLNPNMMQHLGVGGFLGWHFTESIFAGVQFTQFLSVGTETKEDVENSFGLFPERSEIGYAGSARVAWTPLFAKSALVGTFLTHWNAYIFGGGGILRTKLTEMAPMGEIGIGTRFFFGSAFALTLEVSDMMYSENFKDESKFMQSVMLHAGLSVYFPFTFEYRDEQ